MLNFTVGPVTSDETVLKVGSEQVPYFRTPEFSKIMKENEQYMFKMANAPEGSRVIFLTGSGTCSMEATVMNCLDEHDKALVVNGGSFGERFVQLCALHHVPYDEIRLPFGHGLTKEDLLPYENKGYTAFLVNVDETSSGVLYDMDLIGDFCKRNHLFLISDAISSFLADPFDMTANHSDVMLTGSQKALACAPGISIAVLSPRAQERIMNHETKSMYLDMKSMLKNMERGQTPFTPAVGILLEIHARLKEIEDNGGISNETNRIKELAAYFRKQIADLPLTITSDSLPNGVTPLHPEHVDAYDIFSILKDEYHIWVCPNGGDHKHDTFRVGHLGALTKKDYDVLIDALHDLVQRGILS